MRGPPRSSLATHLLRISAYWLGLTAIDASVGLVVQDRVQYDPSLHVDPLMTGTATAAVGLAGALISIVVQPTVGYISDFTESRWGRRKPYIVLGSLFDVAVPARASRTRTRSWRSRRSARCWP